MNCAFCELPEIQERKIIENDFALAFVTNIPIVLYHTIVIPKRHTEKFEDLIPEEKKDIDDLRLKMVGVLRRAFQAEGFNFAWNEGKAAGQSIAHFHLHIVPRKEGDTGIYEYDPRKFLYRPGSREESPEAELRKIAGLIAEKL